MPDSDRMERIDAELIHETPDAYKLDVGSDEPAWVPKSVARPADEDGVFLVEQWFAFDKGLL